MMLDIQLIVVSKNMPQLAERAKPGTDLGVFRQAGFEF